MKLLAKLTLAMAIVALGGCSSTPKKIETGAIRARTYSFVDTGKPAPSFAEGRAQANALVQGAIKKSLDQRGLQNVARDGDVVVAYLIVTGNGVVTTAINDYFGYNRDSTKLLDEAHKAYTSNKNPNFVESGTLLIDIIEAKTWKILKRGYATRPLLENATTETREARLHEVVEEILRGVQFKS